MESSWPSDNDEVSLYESTLEQVIAFDKRKGAVIDDKSICDLDLKHYDLKFDTNNGTKRYKRSPSKRHFDLDINTEIIAENPLGSFTSIDYSENIRPYCRVQKGGKSSPNRLEMIEEDK